MKKTYRVTTEQFTYVTDLDEAEHEALRRKYHGFVSIEPFEPITHVDLDWDRLANDLHEYVRAGRSD